MPNSNTATDTVTDMQFIRLQVQNWRAIKQREIVFGSGVNIVEGANEAGKSSFIEALNILFRERDSSKKKEIRSVTPKGNDVGSTVLLEFKTGDYHLTYEKTFNRRSATSLRMHAPEILQFTGLAAHEKVQSIVESTIDFGLWQALQLEQGTEFAQISLRHSSGLAAALDTAAGGPGTADGHSDLIQRVHAEYLKFYTERSARETGQLAQLRETCLALQNAEDQTLSQLRTMQAQIDHSARLAEQINEQQDLIPELKKSLQTAQQKQIEIDQLHDRQRLMAARREAQELKVSASQQKLADRQLISDNITRQQQLIDATDTQVKDLHKQLLQTDQSLQQSISQRDAAQREREQLEQSIAALNRQLIGLTDRQELDALASRLQQYQQIAVECEALRADYADIKVNEAAIKSLELLDQRQRTLHIRLAARLPELSLTAISDVTINDQSVAAGERIEFDTACGKDIRIGNTATVTFTPATDLDGLQAELDSVSQQLADHLAQYHVTSLLQANAELRRGYDLKQRVLGLTRRLDELSDGDINAMQARVVQLRKTTADTAAAENSEDIRVQLSQQQTQLDDIQGKLARATDQCEQYQLDKATQTARQVMLQERLSGEQAEYQTLARHQTTELTQVSDQALRDELSEQQQALIQIDSAYRQLCSEIEVADGVAVADQLDSARRAVERAHAQCHSDEKALAAVNAQLEQLKTEGLHEKLERLRADRSDAAQQLADTVRAAEAARCLWTTLCEHQRLARLSYARPLSERIAQMGRLVFGHDFQVHLNESLTIEARTLHGVTVPFNDLSGGAREQLGILLRLAAAQLVSGLPLILDDTLGHTDATRLETMGALLNTAGRASQIVVMTCYPQRYRFVGSAEVHRLQPETQSLPENLLSGLDTP